MAPTLKIHSSEINVFISNVTTRTEIIRPNAILCEIQPVSIEEITTKPTEIDAGDTRRLPSENMLHFIDDIIIFSRTFKEHLHRLKLSRLVYKSSAHCLRKPPIYPQLCIPAKAWRKPTADL